MRNHSLMEANQSFPSLLVYFNKRFAPWSKEILFNNWIQFVFIRFPPSMISLKNLRDIREKSRNQLSVWNFFGLIIYSQTHRLFRNLNESLFDKTFLSTKMSLQLQLYNFRGVSTRVTDWLVRIVRLVIVEKRLEIYQLVPRKNWLKK